MATSSLVAIYLYNVYQYIVANILQIYLKSSN
uniref:Uncharacterized protein n=1 Tax=Heterorhabditis bacteriophora TaxID=37862 RepID=A0A1I7WAU9_HETBA